MIWIATWFTPIPRAASFCGSSCTRTAYFCEPYTATWATPLTMESCWAIVVSAYSSSVASGSECDVRAKKRMGAAAGFCFRYDGGRIVVGRFGSACEIAEFTSSAAASMLRSSANWRVTEVEPSVLIDVMLSMPAMAENCFSSGVATVAAIVSGLAPASEALTEMVGKSTVGRSLTGSRV